MTPGPIQDSTLGELEFDEALERWSANLEVGLGHAVELYIGGTDDGPSLALVSFAEILLKHLGEKEATWRTAAAGQVLDCYNDAWNDGPPLSLETLADRLELDSIAVLDRRTAEVAYVPVDEEMFGGHVILCTIHEDDSVSDVQLAG